MFDSLSIINLIININGKTILYDINLKLKTGDVIALVGPNGAGKSTLVKSLMQHYSIEIKKGSILFNKLLLNKLKTYEIARLGFFYVDQNPPQLEGVPMIEFLKEIIKINKPNSSFYENFALINNSFKELSLDNDLLSHSVNVGFSGGQIKKHELIQSKLLDSKVLLLDEIDAGLDIDAIKSIIKYINDSREKHITIIISHDLNIFKKIKPNKVLLIADKTIKKVGGIEIIDDIKKNGYKKYQSTTKQSIKNDPFKF